MSAGGCLPSTTNTFHVAVIIRIFRFLCGKNISFEPLDGVQLSCVWSLIYDESVSECDAGQPRRHLLSTGWSAFVNKKKLVSGDARCISLEYPKK